MKSLLPIAALAAAFLPAPASAQPPTPTRHVVSYADLDLSSAAGRHALDRRIGLTVREACGEASDVDLHGRNVVARCRTALRGQADLQRDAALASVRTGADQIASGR